MSTTWRGSPVTHSPKGSSTPRGRATQPRYPIKSDSKADYRQGSYFQKFAVKFNHVKCPISSPGFHPGLFKFVPSGHGAVSAPSIEARRVSNRIAPCSCSSEIKSKSTIKIKNLEFNLRVFGVIQARFTEIWNLV